MPGQMGAERVTIQNLEIVKVDADQNIILVKGAVPGPKKSLVMLKESVKAQVFKRKEDYIRWQQYLY